MKNFMRVPVILGIVLSFPASVYAVPDNILPSCEATFVGFNANNEKFAQFTAHDDQTLLNTTVTEMVNSTVSVFLSEDGNNKTSVLVATKTDQSQKAIVNAKVSDTAGNVSDCIDAIIVKIGANGNSVEKIYPSLPKKAGDQIIIHVQNASLGINTLDIVVNDTPYQLTLSNGEYKTQDISSSMVDGNENIISFIGEGDPDSRAFIIIYGS